MLEQYFVRPETIDRIRSSWISDAIEQYVRWLSEQGYAGRNVSRRISVLRQFGEFARRQGATTLEDLPTQVEAFLQYWAASKKDWRRVHTDQRRRRLAREVRNPVQQMLRLVVPGFAGVDRRKKASAKEPFRRSAPGFTAYLREERGLRDATIRLYWHHLRKLEGYLCRRGVNGFGPLSPAVLSGFVTEQSRRLAKTSVRDLCGVVRVFLRYLHREQLVAKDLSSSVESPQVYRLSNLPRSITWDEVGRMLKAMDRRTPAGRRDYAILLLLVTYGLRACEVASLTLEGIDWRRERLLIPERKAGHRTAYPLSPIVGEALLEYLKKDRPKTKNRHVFFRVMAPRRPLTHEAISSRASHYLRRAGITVSRAGSHTLRHTCVQRLVDADFSLKQVGDYVGHRAAASTEIYSKISIEALREVACGDGEAIL
ncbi:MAG: site-specific integrase [Anaerolineae bacterium]